MIRAHLASLAGIAVALAALSCNLEEVEPDGDGQGGTGGETTGGAGGTPPPPPPPGSTDLSPDDTALTLLTWNMETFPLTDYAPPFVHQTLNQLRPDIIAVQEINEPAVFQDFALSLPDYDFVLNDDDGFLRLGFLYRPQRVTLVSVDTLFRDEPYAFPRPPLRGHFLGPEIGGPAWDFDLVNVHLKAKGDTQSVMRRRAACILLEQWTSSRINTGGDPDIIIAGDWNDRLTDPPEANVFVPFLDQPERYTFPTLVKEQEGQSSYIAFSSFIDHFLITNETLDELGENGVTTVLALDQLDPAYATAVSDHRPVMMRFANPQGPAASR